MSRQFRSVIHNSSPWPGLLCTSLPSPVLCGGIGLPKLDGWKSRADDVCERLSREVAAELESKPGEKWRCPVPLRTRIVSYSKVCRERGEPLLDISNRLGLVESTLARWLCAERKDLEAGFLPVSIFAAEAAGLGNVGAPMRLITLRGYTASKVLTRRRWPSLFGW